MGYQSQKGLIAIVLIIKQSIGKERHDLPYSQINLQDEQNYYLLMNYWPQLTQFRNCWERTQFELEEKNFQQVAELVAKQEEQGSNQSWLEHFKIIGLCYDYSQLRFKQNLFTLLCHCFENYLFGFKQEFCERHHQIIFEWLLQHLFLSAISKPLQYQYLYQPGLKTNLLYCLSSSQLKIQKQRLKSRARNVVSSLYLFQLFYLLLNILLII